jgi:hypothetical protein
MPALTAAEKKLLNNATPGTKKVKLGDRLSPGAAVVNATDAATAITQLNALLAVLRTKGIIAP